MKLRPRLFLCVLLSALAFFQMLLATDTIVKNLEKTISFEELDHHYGLSHIPGFSLEHRRIVEDLLEEGQSHLFGGWDGPCIANPQKLTFLQSILQVDQEYPGGIKGYLLNHAELIHQWRIGSSTEMAFASPKEEVVEIVLEKSPGCLNPDFLKWEAKGLQYASKLAVVLVAGGVGKRLGYQGIKLEFPLESILQISQLERYSRWIKATEEESNQIKIPFYIMTSQQTYEGTVKLLEKKNYFGLRKDQIFIMKQNSVPSIVPATGKIAKDPQDKYALKKGGAGHGAVHQLMYDLGYAERLAKENRYILFVQDTNSQITNGALVALAQSIEKNWSLNFLAALRDPQEAASLIMDFYDSQNSADHGIRATLEYTLADSQLKAAAANSHYLAYTGAIIMHAGTYDSILQETKGEMIGKVKPKGEDDEVRIEYQYEDIAFFFKDKGKAGVTYFKDKRFVFSPVKNSFDRAADLEKRGNYPDAQGTGESDFLKENRRLLKMAGVNIQVEGCPFKIEGLRNSEQIGYHIEEGAKVTLSPDFALTGAIAREKILGHVSISPNSVLAIRGKNITLKNVVLEGGALILDIPEGFFLDVHDILLKGGGWQYQNSEKENSIGEYYLKKLPETPVIDTRAEDIQKYFQKEGSGHYELTQINDQPVVRFIQ